MFVWKFIIFRVSFLTTIYLTFLMLKFTLFRTLAVFERSCGQKRLYFHTDVIMLGRQVISRSVALATLYKAIRSMSYAHCQARQIYLL